MSLRSLFKYSPADMWLVCLSFLSVGLYLYAFLAIQRAQVPWVTGLVLIGLTCTNYQCIAHNFIHTPFFRSRLVNKAFSVFNSLALGYPQSGYHVHHMNHHQYNNDIKIAGRRPRDLSSTFAFGVGSAAEHPIRYCLLGIFRTQPVVMTRRAHKRAMSVVWLEWAAIIVFFGGLAGFEPAYLLFFLVVAIGGQVLALFQNYAEHAGCDGNDVRRCAVSCYSRLYNLLWFNNGYHLEHHIYPRVHWQQLPQYRTDEEGTRKCRGWHLSIFLDSDVRKSWRTSS